jgi:hypothetical protein
LAKRTTRIDDSDHVCRYVRPTLLDIDPETDKVRGVFNAAFHLKASDEGELSVNHLQHYAGEVAEQLKAIMLAKKASGFGVKNTSAFAVLQAGEITEAGKKAGLSLASYKDPMLPHDPSHAVVRGLPPDTSSEVFEDLARISSKRFFLTKDL